MICLKSPFWQLDCSSRANIIKMSVHMALAMALKAQTNTHVINGLQVLYSQHLQMGLVS